ncbi:hypothetical protein [uncultured Erythrobacter sp.]|uniref:hypothetical protein n=1 Tax=uncultured Erythrobacter sp. TaxID=263913 RepID=UPI00262DAB32|nr:hypothetical protein [uncultured Erythrobacter sp.]
MRNQIIALLAGSMLAGCGPNFAELTSYDRRVFNAAGSITVSNAKLYSREALIEERRKDLAWIDRLIEESTNPSKVKFTPQLEREVETVTAFSAALGLSFDPAAARSFDRNDETAEIEQRIDLLKLQFELEKVEQQIAAFRASPPQDLGLPESSTGANGEAGASSDRQAASLERLEETVKSLSSLATRGLQEEQKLPTRLNFSTDPIDDFRDRLAYRNILRSARNSAALDELHDRGGNRLYRLNFQATAIPDPEYLKSLGVIDMKIVPPDADAAKKAFDRWLELLNNDSALRWDDDRDKFAPNGDAFEVANSPDFQLITHFGREVIIPDIGSNVQSARSIVAAAESVVTGVGLDEIARGNSVRSNLISSVPAASAEIINLMCAESSSEDRQESWNTLVAPFYQARGQNPSSLALQQADLRLLARDAINGESYRAQERIFGRPRADDYVKFENILSERLRGYQTFKRAMAEMGIEECPNIELPTQELTLETQPLIDKLTSDPAASRARIYEIGPRELVQQVSTLARAANSLAIAASIAANDPGSAISGSAAGAYSRSSAGRTAAIERVPSVVGYAQSRNEANHFGWVLGPQAVLDPEGRVLMEQQVSPYDLAVDVSVPGWWRALALKVATKWAPSPNELAETGFAASVEQTVPLASDIDLRESLIAFFSTSSSGSMAVDDISGNTVSECYASTILVEGRNLWRVQTAILGGIVIEGSNIKLAPDMRGILITAPKIPEVLALGNSDDLPLVLLSPRETIDKDASNKDLRVKFSPKPAGGTCPGTPPKKPADPNQPQISQIANGAEQLHFFAGNAIDISIRGKNLDQLGTEVSLEQAEGRLEQVSGDSARVRFTSSATVNLAQRTYTLTFYKKGKDNKRGAPHPQTYRVQISEKKED